MKNRVSVLSPGTAQKLIIRFAEPRDAASIAYVHVHAWKETYPGMISQSYLDSLSVEERTTRWKNALAKKSETVFVAEVNGELAGFVCGGNPQMPELGFSCELYAIYLLRAYQKIGLGKKLFEAFRAAMAEQNQSGFYLWVIKQNTAAIFYEKMNGTKHQSKTIEIGGQNVVEDLFVWQLEQRP